MVNVKGKEVTRPRSRGTSASVAVDGALALVLVLPRRSLHPCRCLLTKPRGSTID